MIAQKARDVRSVEPLLHLPRGIGGIGQTSLEIVEEVAQQQQMIMQFSFDDSVSDPNPVVDVRQDQPAHLIPLNQLSPDSKHSSGKAFHTLLFTTIVGISAESSRM